MGEGIQRIIERQRASGFSGFQGARITGTIPVSEAVLNAAMQAILSERETPIQRMRLSLPGGNRIVVDLMARVLIVNKAFRLELEADELIDFAREPILRLRLVGAGLTGFLIEIVSGVFRQEGIRITGGAILVDLREIMARQDQDYLLSLLRWVRIRGQAGRLDIEFLVSVPHEGEERRQAEGGNR
jgi:hypothetical protein